MYKYIYNNFVCLFERLCLSLFVYYIIYIYIYIYIYIANLANLANFSFNLSCVLNFSKSFRIVGCMSVSTAIFKIMLLLDKHYRLNI